MEIVGGANRFVKFLHKEVVNKSFEEYCVKECIKLPSQYRAVRPVMEAGFKSAAKYDRDQPVLDEELWSISGDWAKEHFYPVMGGSRVMSQDDVVKGNAFTDGLDMSTSCGYPWSLEFKNKRDFFDRGNITCLEDFWQDMLLLEHQTVPIWTCSQKRELRDVEKLATLSHRTFTASPLELTVANNRLCVDMNEKFYGGGDRTWSFVGTSKFSRGWHRLYQRLFRLPHAFELDESAYDASLFLRAMMEMVDFRWQMLCEEDRTLETRIRLEQLYYHIVHSVIIMENGELVLKHTGNPSGSGNTIVDNTIILYRLLAYAWLCLCKEIGRVTSRQDFESNVEGALNGDDNTFTVSKDCVSWFNPRNISRVWSGIGVTTTTPCEDPRELKDVRFLSNGFRYVKCLETWLPTPDTERVLCSLMYGSSMDDVRWHFLRACALRLDSYGNDDCRRILAGYIAYLNDEYASSLNGSVTFDGNSMTMSEIRCVWKSDAWIEGLYCGRECLSLNLDKFLQWAGVNPTTSAA